MGAVLALSAACKCHDLVPRWTAELQEMRELLSLADKHHQQSLEQLREAISASNFNAVLANAALMVLYALSAHSVRVHLALRAKKAGVALPRDVLPFHSQWITSIRAAYVAYVGLDRHVSNLMPSPGASVTEADEAWLLRQAHEQQHAPQDGPSEETKRLLLPLMSATYQAALEKLRLRCQDAASRGRDVQSEACMASYHMLADLVEMTLGSGATPSAESTDSQDSGVLNNAYPWLARYLARVTSARPSKLSRRTTMAFLNRVPNEFLHLVQSALDCMPMDQDHPDNDGPTQQVELHAAHQPAMDIFAHWLVLVMLLDGVWWIGDVGRWELGRVLGFVKAQGWLADLSSGGAWWPQTMYDIKATLDDGGA